MSVRARRSYSETTPLSDEIDIVDDIIDVLVGPLGIGIPRAAIDLLDQRLFASHEVLVARVDTVVMALRAALIM